MVLFVRGRSPQAALPAAPARRVRLRHVPAPLRPRGGQQPAQHEHGLLPPRGGVRQAAERRLRLSRLQQLRAAHQPVFVRSAERPVVHPDGPSADAGDRAGRGRVHHSDPVEKPVRGDLRDPAAAGLDDLHAEILQARPAGGEGGAGGRRQVDPGHHRDGRGRSRDQGVRYRKPGDRQVRRGRGRVPEARADAHRTIRELPAGDSSDRRSESFVAVFRGRFDPDPRPQFAERRQPDCRRPGHPRRRDGRDPRPAAGRGDDQRAVPERDRQREAALGCGRRPADGAGKARRDRPEPARPRSGRFRRHLLRLQPGQAGAVRRVVRSPRWQHRRDRRADRRGQDHAREPDRPASTTRKTAG